MPPCKETTSTLSTSSSSSSAVASSLVVDNEIVPNDEGISEHVERLVMKDQPQKYGQTRRPPYDDNDHNNDDPVLKALFIVTTYLCISMVFWILIAPASWLIERSSFHKEIMLPYLESRGSFRVVPRTIIDKYQGHSLVQFTHILPGAVWAGVLPFQLHPTWRKKHRKLHRLFGYLFLFASLFMALGVIVILKRKLTFEHFFSDDNPPSPISSSFLFKPIMLTQTVWFAGTSIQAVRMARRAGTGAGARYYHQLHQKWILRHVASGIWITAQRFIAIPLCDVVLRVTRPPAEEIGQWLQREIFADTALSAAFICLCLGEYTIRRISNNNNNHHSRVSSPDAITKKDH